MTWLADLQDIVKMMLAGLPVIATLGWFHRERGRRFDKLEKKVDTISLDFGGLNNQLVAIVQDVERRFLPRDEHTHAVTRLDGNIIELNRNLNALNGHLFDLARERRGGGA